MNAPLPLAWLQPAKDRPTREATGAAAPEAARAPGSSSAPNAPSAPDAPQVRHMVWHSRHGTIEISVIGQTIYVNGQAVQPAPAAE